MIIKFIKKTIYKWSSYYLCLAKDNAIMNYLSIVIVNFINIYLFVFIVFTLI